MAASSPTSHGKGLTRKQKFWFAGLGGAAAAAGAGAALMLKHKVGPAEAAYKGAKKVITAVNLAGPTAKGAVADVAAGYRRNRVVQGANRKLWKATGLRIVPKEAKASALDAITPAKPGRFQAAKDVVKGVAQDVGKAYKGLASKTPKARQQQRQTAFAQRMRQQKLPAPAKGALNLRVSGHIAEVVDAGGQTKVPRFLDTPNQGKLAKTLRSGKKKISESNINRLLDQRRAMKVPGAAAPMTIGHHGGFASNPKGLDVYAAAPGKKTRGGRAFTADRAAKEQERTLRNLGPQKAADLHAKREEMNQKRLLTDQRKKVVKWWRGGYRSAKKQ